MSEFKNIDVSIGQTVSINPRNDRSRKKLVSGVVSEILTKNLSHPHGVLVKLENGEIGRVRPEGHQTNKAKVEAHKEKIQLSSAKQLIANGETHFIEFKADALWSSKYTAEDIQNHRPQSSELRAFGKNTSKIIIAKTIAAFLNSEGGHLVIGFKEGKDGNEDEVIGVDVEFNKLKDPSIDGYRRMITEIIKDYFPSGIFNMFNSHFKISFDEIEGKNLCVVSVSKSKKRVFLKLQKKDYFFVRIDASTRELQGEEVVEYCENRF